MSSIYCLFLSIPAAILVVFLYTMFFKAILRIFKSISSIEKVKKAEMYIIIHFLVILFGSFGNFLDTLLVIDNSDKQMPSLFCLISIFLSNLSLCIILMFPVCRYKKKIGITPKTHLPLTAQEIERTANENVEISYLFDKE